MQLRGRDDIFKSLVGVLGIYLGFNRAYLFLIEIGILDNFYIEGLTNSVIMNKQDLYLLTLERMSKSHHL
jgi:hypothetical protein